MDFPANTLRTRDGRLLSILPASRDDWPNLLPILRHVIHHEDSHCIDGEHSDEILEKIWFSHGNRPYRVMLGDALVATFFLRANFDGRGRHVANASYMVHPAWRGLGIGQSMGEFSLNEARRLGFTAMQYNSVVSTNERALNLWLGLGFRIVGTIPLAYWHRALGRHVDTHVLFRFL